MEEGEGHDSKEYKNQNKSEKYGQKRKEEQDLQCESFAMRVHKGMFSRFLYTNPVCLLTTNDGKRRNVMTISWLTPVNNSVGSSLRSTQIWKYLRLRQGNICMLHE